MRKFNNTNLIMKTAKTYLNTHKYVGTAQLYKKK